MLVFYLSGALYVYTTISVEPNEQHLNIDKNFDYQMSLSKRKCWYSKMVNIF